MNWEVEIKRVADSGGEEYFDLYINGKLRYCAGSFEDAMVRENVLRKQAMGC